MPNISHFGVQKQCSVRLYLQLVVGRLMAYLRYMCLFMDSGTQHTLCYVFYLPSSCVPYVAGFSWLFIPHNPFGIL
jgi:hypothetical protein